MRTLSVVIPAYNEEDSVAEVVERVLATRQALAGADIDLELIVVDDGSHDRTAEQVAENPDVRLIRHEMNRGYGAALKSGFGQAKGDWLAFLDADGTYPPEALPDLCQIAVIEGADLVVGSRMGNGAGGMPATRRLGNTLFAGLVSLVANTRVRDCASGMRVIRRETLPRLYPLPDGLNFTPVMSTRALHEGIRIVEVPIAYDERVGQSKLSILHDGTRFLQSIIWTALLYNPVRILGMVGIAATLVALAILGGLVALRLQGVTTLGIGWAFALFAAQVLAVTGVALFALGAMFNYLVSLFHRRSIRQGLFGRPIFTPGIDRHFGWMGLLSAIAGVGVGLVSVFLGMRSGWPIARLWLYLLGSAMLILIGVQLVVSWVVMRALEELSQRDAQVATDMQQT
jgi:glycosyltransferase involved in cell wall biosynthesis